MFWGGLLSDKVGSGDESNAFVGSIEYVELAVKEGVVTVGGDKGLAWICLSEDCRDKLLG
jgi:hypothetical protein